jgi:Domain of unknown function (DUF4124)
MKSAIYLLYFFSAFTATLHAQTMYKCGTAEGGTEYRNSPCEKGQRSAGAINKGTVTTVAPSTSPSPAASDAPASGFGLGALSGLSNPIKAMRDDAAPVDNMAIGLCKSEGGYYVQGAGCLSEPPKNRNPAIGEAKMRDICKQTGQTYVKQLNDCVAAAKKSP